MIYENNQSGVFKFVNDMGESQKVTIGYFVGGIEKEATFNLFDLPEELTDEFATLTNKIARHIEESDLKR